VLERQGDAIRFHPTLLEFASHYRFDPRPVAIARGNEKGRVERAIKYVRESFFAGRTLVDLDDLNAQADAWCRGMAADRRCPGDESKTVREAFRANDGPWRQAEVLQDPQVQLINRLECTKEYPTLCRRRGIVYPIVSLAAGRQGRWGTNTNIQAML